MKTISKKQFENAVAKVLTGGKSSMIATYEAKPFSWTRSKGHVNLSGSQPENSIYLRNDAPRGGADGQVFLVAELKQGYEITPTKAELKAKKAKAKKANNERKSRLQELAKINRCASVAEFKKLEKQAELHNTQRLQNALNKRELKFEELEGRKFDIKRLVDRVRISRIELEFECEPIEILR
jgi:hypothetical protein